ncbi:MAG TPA: hypothetical protein VHI52_12935 [Verrucomicrobiae bacterium]|nr:hypothetical protein [Verrucomicrobiae bacterium]
MSSFREIRRRCALPLAGLCLALFYLLGFLPLARRAANLDAPLDGAWRKLAASLEQTNSSAIDFLHLTNQLAETRQALNILEDTKKKAAARLQLSDTLRNQLNSPFQLVDFQNERSKQIDELDQEAKKQHITVDPGVYSGFPEHTVDLRDPSLLWPALALTDDLLGTAVRSKVTAIHSLEVVVDLTNAPPTDSPGRWSEIPIQVEFTASADSAAKVIESLPLRAEEIHAAGLPDAPAEKAPLLIDRLIIRKQTPEKLDEVRVWLRAVGFVLRD